MSDGPKPRKLRASSPSAKSRPIQTLILNPSMARKSSILKQILSLICFILIVYAAFNTFHSPAGTSKLEHSLFYGNSISSFSSENFQSFPGNSVKIYLYDLPTRFTYGVIQHHSLARGGQLVEDVTQLKYPGHQHMAEWYLFIDLARPGYERVGSPIVRVSDPEEADLFYVPFFSSLSLVVNPIRPPSGIGLDKSSLAYSDGETQEALLDWLEGQEYWRRNNGWDHVIIASDPNALYRVIDKVKNSVLLVSDFGRLRRDQGSLVKDVIVPYSHRINNYEGGIGIENRNTLLFFMGNRYRKEVKHFFLYGEPNGTVGEIWRQVAQKLPLIKLMINRDKRLVKRNLNELDCSCLCSNHTGIITNL